MLLFYLSCGSTSLVEGSIEALGKTDPLVNETGTNTCRTNFQLIHKGE